MSTSRFCPHCGAANSPTDTLCSVCQEQLDVLHEAQTTPTLLNGRYQLLKEIGAGGFGAVYRAQDTQEQNRPVAVKQIHLKGLSSQEIIEATDGFNREAEILTSLNHPQLPRISDRFSDPEHWYLVMDFIDGQTLDAYFQQCTANNLADHQGLSLDETLAIGRQLCEVLHYLHSQQPPIIFRDLKPGNIMRMTNGRLYLIDFGIARRFKPGQAKDTIPFGSPGFAAPEQYGRAQTTVQADIYSLGALLYYLHSGDDPSEHPFRFPPLRLYGGDDIRALDFLIQRMVALDSQDRPESILDVQHELQRIQDISTQADASRVWTSPQSQTPPSPDSAIFSGQIQIQQQPEHVIYARPSLPQPAAPAVVSNPIPATDSFFGSADLISRRRLLFTGVGATGLVGISTILCRIFTNEQTPQMATAQNGVSQIPQDFTPTPAITSDPTTWSADLRYLASTDLAQQQVKIWSAQNEEVLQTIPLPANLLQLTVSWSLDNRKILLYENPHFCMAWDIQNKRQLFTLPSFDITSTAWSPDGQYLALGYHDTVSTTSFAVLHTSNGKQLFSQRIDSGSNTTLTCLAWSSESRYVVFGGEITSDSMGILTTQLEIWDAQKPQRISQWSNVMDRASSVIALAWSPSGHTIGIITNHTLWLNQVAASNVTSTSLDLTTIFSYYAYSDITYSSMFWAPDEKRLALLIGGTLVVIDIASRKNILQANSDQNTNLVALTWSPDGKSITTADQNNNLFHWFIG